MEILITAVISFILGFVVNKMKTLKRKRVSVDEDELREKKEQYKKMKKSFNELMNYDYDIAIGSDK